MNYKDLSDQDLSQQMLKIRENATICGILAEYCSRRIDKLHSEMEKVIEPIFLGRLQGKATEIKSLVSAIGAESKK